MILSNYWKYLTATIGAPYYAREEAAHTGVVNTEGNPTSSWINSASSSWTGYIISNRCTRVSSHIVVGSGDTAASIDDYALADTITNLSNVVASDPIVSTDVDGNMTSLYNFSASNLTGSDVVIREVGIEKINYPNVQSQSYDYVLFARKVLDEPIVVPNNTTFNITFKWTEG